MSKIGIKQPYGVDLHAFIEKALLAAQGKRLNKDDRYISFLVRHLELFLAGKPKKLLINLPGRHLKTFIFSVCLPAFALGSDPTLKFMVVCYNEGLAEDIVRQVREIMESDWYQAVFKTRISDRHSRKNDFIVKGGGRVRAVPVRSVTGKGGDVIIFDDAHNADDWDNDRKKAKVIEAFSLLVSRRDGGKFSRMLVVGHRVAEDDLSAHLIERGDFEHVCLPLFAPNDMTLTVGDFTLQLKKGESLRQEEFPPDEIDSIRQDHRGSPFWLYFQQGLGPRSDDFEINHSHFPFMPKRSGRVPDAPVVISVDTAQSTHSVSRNVIHVYVVRGIQYELIQVFAEKCSFTRLAKMVEFFANRYEAYFVLIENTARGPDLIDELKPRLSMPIVPVQPKGSKSDRLRKCMPIIRAKRVRIARSEAVEEAVDEILVYPNSPYDDHVDALTNFLLKVSDLFLSEAEMRRYRLELQVGTAQGSNPSPPARPIQGIVMLRRRSIFEK